MWSPDAVHSLPLGRTRDIIDQVTGILKIRDIKTFGEPVVDGCEKVASFGGFALITPKAREARGGT
jgi:hypothetical protein